MKHETKEEMKTVGAAFSAYFNVIVKCYEIKTTEQRNEVKRLIKENVCFSIESTDNNEILKVTIKSHK